MADTATPRRMTAAGLFGTTVRTFFRAPIFFLALSAVQSIPAPVLDRLSLPVWILPYRQALAILLAQVLLDLAQAPMLARAVLLLDGERPTFYRALALSRRRIIPVMVVSLVEVLAAGLGFVLLIVPGLVVLAVTMAAGPICLEGAGPLAALRRSATATQGFRLQIVGALLLTWLPTLILFVVLFLALKDSPAAAETYGLYASIAILSLVSAWVTILASVVHRELRCLEGDVVETFT